ncbi:MAG: glycine betaine transporter [uncultured bacterium]|nr:MAG: glycine betaine transporter [uncultured bacterium]OGT26867.1 MAG: hypothetical protein A3B71_02050 [Gammaproteobacteria bacterium RIFCSPHIGHO2_02_FULL_42_43]OGT53396.1 MAG: hypothetical protein A3E54_06725 [Gammaproteobacteria bacterium RIFCSPHIGHO2_12_FULL_41_25]OGT63408.1 MAG: hypothetical protein A3I77_05780 [Gammaproteobacteria bacterium RIFCSPLOWO2_02_FULL_42_14]OGT87334.1 MAG: hypothetical protein A3G86_00225 [Gammaproteobacteria bacterium RIFCSPLOWO2_12_FULL_42_18]
MNYLFPKKKLMLILNPLLAILGAYLFFAFPDYLPIVGYLFWIPLLCALILIITPLGSTRLAHSDDGSKTRRPLLKWLLAIFILEFLLTGTFAGICLINGKLLLINTAAHPQLLSETLKTELLQNGLFPWGIYAVIAAGMGVIAFRKQKDAYCSELMKPFTKEDPSGSWSAVINVGARRATIFAVSVTLVFFTLLLVSVVLPLSVHIPHEYHPTALLVTLLFVGISFSQLLKRHVMRLFARRISTVWGFLIFGLVLAAVLIFLNATVSGIATQVQQPVIPAIIQRWMQYSWENAWTIFSVLWWVCLTPLVASFIARISKGYRVREIIFAVLLFPALFSFFLARMENTAWQSTITMQLISLLCFIFLLPLLVNHGTSEQAILSYLPKNNESKPRDHHPFFQKIVQLTLIHFYFYLVIGINGLSAFLFTFCFLTVPAMVIMTVSSLFLRRHVQHQ